MKVCPNCKNEIADDLNFCGKCGKKIEENPQEKPKESQGIIKKLTKGKRKFIFIGVIAIIAIIAFYFISTSNHYYDDGEISFSYQDSLEIVPNNEPNNIVILSDGLFNYEIYKYPMIEGYTIQDYATYQYYNIVENETFTNVTNFQPIRIAGTTGYQWEYESRATGTTGYQWESESIEFKATEIMLEKNGILYNIYYKYSSEGLKNNLASNIEEDIYAQGKKRFEKDLVNTFNVY